MEQGKIKVELMLKTVLAKTNELIEALDKMNPADEGYGRALENLAKSFQILSGAILSQREEKNGGK
jgi:hypothetical protein